jgi:hypothetical protein
MSEVIHIQAQDSSGMWRTYQTTSNNPQMILIRMKELKDRYPTFRVRAVDKDGRVVDLYG